MSKRINKKLKGFSLMELILAISLFSLMILVVGTMVIESLRASRNLAQRDSSAYAIKEIFNAVTITKNDLWSSIVGNTGDGTKHLVFADNKYSIVNGTDVTNGVTTGFIIDYANRDASGNILQIGGTIDPHTREITVTASWDDILGNSNSVSSIVYVNDWNTLEMTQTTQADFNTGTFYQTKSTSVVNGEVQLQEVFYPDWCKPSLALNSYDIPGSATAKTLFSSPGNTYLGTAGNATGDAFTKVNISGVDNPTIIVEGTFNGYLTNMIFVSGNYAYLATPQDGKEVVILDISHTPYTEVGYFNTSRTDDGLSVFVLGNIGYLASGKYVYTFNLTAKTGSRPLLGELKVSLNQNWGKVSSVSQIMVRGNYLYGALFEDWYEMSIVNVTNPASMSIASQTNVNNQQTSDIYVSLDGKRTYFGTNSSSSEREFYIINTTVKTGNDRPIIGKYDTNGMSIKGITVVENDKRAILVGINAEEYQVVNLNTEATPIRCGGMQFNSGINDVDAVQDGLGNSFAYMVTNDATHDFQILRGGPGVGGGDNGYGYLPDGYFDSQVFDTNSTSTHYYYLDWSGVVPANTTLQVQVRTGTTADLSAELWRGPDGQTTSFFNTQGPTNFGSYFQSKRYFQYKVYLTSNTINAPRFDQLKINYQK